jgi:hypothetical protein
MSTFLRRLSLERKISGLRDEVVCTLLIHGLRIAIVVTQLLAATLFEHGPAPLGDHGSATVREDAHQT